MKRIFVLIFLMFTQAAGILAQAPGKVDPKFEKGLELCSKGAPQEGVVLLREVYKKTPSNHEVSYALASCYEQLKETNQAVELYRKTISLKEDYFMAYVKLANIHKQNRETSQAINQYHQAYSHAQNNDDKARAKAQILLLLEAEDKLNKEALPHIQDFKKVSGGRAPAKIYYIEAKIYFNVKNYQNAAKAAKNALRRMRGASQASEEMSLIFLKSAHETKNFEAMGEYLNKVESEPYISEVRKFNHIHYYQLGYAYYFMRDFKQSAAFLETALKIKPDYNKARIFQNYIQGQETDKMYAIKHTKAKIEKDEHDALYYADLARLYLHEKKYSEAEKAADLSLNESAGDHEVLFLKGIAFYKQKKFGKAADLFRKLAERNNYNDQITKAKYAFALGIVYRDMGRKSDAEAAFKTSDFDLYEDASRLEIEKLKD